MTNGHHNAGVQVTDVTLYLLQNYHHGRTSVHLNQAEYIWGLDAWRVRWRLRWIVGGVPGYPRRGGRTSSKARIDSAEPLDPLPPGLKQRELSSLRLLLLAALKEAEDVEVAQDGLHLDRISLETEVGA